MLAAVLVGAESIAGRTSPIEAVGGAALLAGGLAGFAVAAGGGNPFTRWGTVLALLTGVVLARVGDPERDLPLIGAMLAGDAD